MLPGDVQEFVTAAAVIGVIDFQPVKGKGQDPGQGPLQQSRMGQESQPSCRMDQVDTGIDGQAVIRHVGRAAAVQYRIEYGFHIGKIPFGDEHAGNMRPAYGPPFGQHPFYLAAVDVIAERYTPVGDLQSPVQTALFELPAILRQLFLIRPDIVAQDMDIFPIIITAHFNSRDDPYARCKRMTGVSSHRIVVGNGHDRKAGLCCHLRQLFRRIQAVRTGRMHMQIYIHDDWPPLSHSRTVLMPVPVAPI